MPTVSAWLSPDTTDERGREIMDRIFNMKGILAASFNGEASEVVIQHDLNPEDEHNLLREIWVFPEIKGFELK